MIVTESEWNTNGDESGERSPSLPPSISSRNRDPSSSQTRFRSPNPANINVQYGSEESPQRYEERTSQEAIVYTFVQQSFNSMLLTYQPAMLPLYHISNQMNCFIPSSYITIIRRGDSENGKYVGQFEMGVSVKKSTIIMDGKEKLTDAVFVTSKDRYKRRIFLWTWLNDESRHLSWSFEGPVKYCYLRSLQNAQSPMLATYTPCPLTPRADARPSPPTVLKVYPAGQDLFDHIIMSVLIMERKRLTPGNAASLMSWSLT
ncbi:hypothetical protein BXZ70DRAFT_774716 [Cristinia sonorae]|uniref:DUF6593 domain-containing protein n=1 Tax=Cristinia sonorae TaxID=1940300 RepID=A0A8K0UUX4_9AGAR|nr:hypothetical protein BXZ70DRAFT_774716 [Cristinia sonorae]